MLTADEILDILTHESLKRLENRGDGWAIVYVSHDGESVKEFFDADFNRLLSDWVDLVATLDAAAEDRLAAR